MINAPPEPSPPPTQRAIGELGQAIRDELLLRNISERCSLPRVMQHQVRAITTAELSRFLQAIDGKQFRNISFPVSKSNTVICSLLPPRDARQSPPAVPHGAY